MNKVKELKMDIYNPNACPLRNESNGRCNVNTSIVCEKYIVTNIDGYEMVVQTFPDKCVLEDKVIEKASDE